jgi:cytochrome d ubiquinol oxidase subunit I
MVGLGTIFLGITGIALLLLFWKQKLFTWRWMHWVLFLAMPFPFIANIAGWFTTETGRQPWIIFGLMRTINGSSTTVSPGNIMFTLLGFAGIYLLLGLLYVFLVVSETLHGPTTTEPGQPEPSTPTPPTTNHAMPGLLSDAN